MYRVGFGTDSHRLEEGLPLILGGVKIPFKKGLISYSDGDVVIHSLIDAILGAAGLGDIGEHFPDSDPRFKGISSSLLLKNILEKVAGDWKIANIDITIVAQKPKLENYKEQIKRQLCKILEIGQDKLNVKATTTEGMGFEGRGEGITAYSICLLESATTVSRPLE